MVIFHPFFLLFTASIRSRPPGPPAVPGVLFSVIVKFSVKLFSLKLYNTQNITLAHPNTNFSLLRFRLDHLGDRRLAVQLKRILIGFFKCLLSGPFICLRIPRFGRKFCRQISGCQKGNNFIHLCSGVLFQLPFFRPTWLIFYMLKGNA